MLKLRRGAKLVIEVEGTDKGFKISIGKRVGGHGDLGSAKHVKTEEEMWLTIIRWGERKLAQLGLEKTEN